MNMRGITGEVEGHVALVAVAEVLHDVLGPLVGLGEQHPVGVLVVDGLAQQLEDRRGSREVLAVGPVALDQVRAPRPAEAVEPEVQPEAQHVEDRLDDLGVVVVEVGLVEKKRCQ
jgi:hypothetical protein